MSIDSFHSAFIWRRMPVSRKLQTLESIYLRYPTGPTRRMEVLEWIIII